MSNTWTIQVDTPYSTSQNPGTTIPFTYSPSGCFRGSYSYRFGGTNNANLYLIHAGGETLLGGNWQSSILRGFTVRQISLCAGQTLTYDCINGECIQSSQFNTPGIYTSLAQCESQCGGATCKGKCLSNSDWAQIEGLAAQLKNKSCS
ncbi:hypothetical protein Nos7524_3095 [Nostoc sp. PCC 7524]|uniref:hypothetical protein n=1 Tax=Nostoc sp. (strain ATCC 29411 / PCC 7524) TaxID=28072 RepID=UPI00029EFF05|nr:hypothetical protein [Nostoc sp. PCC 7524]AFY48898.1 hypothetical protein Nos7524_3095 [Nostoc sp. PCC 7524]